MSSSSLPPEEAADRPARATDTPGNTLVVTEIYRSIQGESTWAGIPCTFIRLTGCNLRCVWCDSEYAFHGGVRMTLPEILAECRRLGGPLVEITGGEPLLQKGCPCLAEALLAEGYIVLCETSGALPLTVLPGDVIKIMDLAPRQRRVRPEPLGQHRCAAPAATRSFARQPRGLRMEP